MSAQDAQSAALIAEAIAVVAHLPSDRVSVTGQGSLAQQLRGRGLGGGAGEPLAVIETTGLAAELTAGCAAVASGGLVVLAAEAAEPIDIDLYRDVHRRGLALVGVSGQGAPMGPGDDSLDPRA